MALHRTRSWCRCSRCRCLEKEPDRRFQSAADLAFALQPSSVSAPLAIVPKRRAWLKWAAMADILL